MNKDDRPLVTLDHNALLGYFKVEENRPDQNSKHQEDAEAMRRLCAMNRAGVIRLCVPQSGLMETQLSGQEMDELAYGAQIAERLVRLGMDKDDIFIGPRPVGISTVDEPTTFDFSPELQVALQAAIHSILFEGKVEPDAKNIDFDWFPYRDRMCQRRGIVDNDWRALVELDGIRRRGDHPLPSQVPSTRLTPALDALDQQRRNELQAQLTSLRKDWTNAKCDAVGLYTHVTQALATTVPEQAVFVTSDKNFTRFNNVLKQTNWERLKALHFPGHVMEPSEAVAFFE